MKTKLLLVALITATTIISTNAQEQMTNGEFETWQTAGLGEDPTGWGSTNQFTQAFTWFPVLCEKTTDANSGTYALKLATDTVTLQAPLGSGLDTVGASIGLNSDLFADVNGLPFTSRPDSLVGFTKASFGVGGGGFIMIELTKWDPVGDSAKTIGESGYMRSTTASSYERFAAEVMYYSSEDPDTLLIIMFAGIPGQKPEPGTEFFIDDLAFAYQLPLSGVTAVATDENVGTCNGTATATPTLGTAPYTYLWDDPSAQATATATGLCAGTYNVTVTDAAGDNATATATVGLIAGIYNNSSVNESVNVYPNPASVDLFIEANEPGLSLEIRDITGRLVKRVSNLDIKTKIDVDALMDGIYTYQLKTRLGMNYHTGRLLIAN